MPFRILDVAIILDHIEWGKVWDASYALVVFRYWESFILSRCWRIISYISWTSEVGSAISGSDPLLEVLLLNAVDLL